MLASSISRDNEISIIELIDNINLIVYGSLLEGAFLNMQDYANTTRRGAGLPYKWIVACTVVFGIFMSILDSTVANIAIPRLQTAFGASLDDVQWVLSGYTLALGVTTPLTGYLAERLGTKRLYLLALTIFTICSALCGLAWSLPVLIFFRILQAMGGAFLFPISITLLYSEFPPHERGMAMGVLGVPILFAPALGPTLGGYLITYASWQLIFYINVPIGIVGIIMATIFLRELPHEGNPRFDGWGFALSGIGLGSVLYAFSNVSKDGWGSGTVLGFLGGGLVTLCLFVALELSIIKQEGQPLLNLRFFADSSFTPNLIANMFVTFILFGGLLLLPLYLQILRGLSPYQAGLFLLPQALCSMVVVVVGGRLVDKIGTKRVVLPGLLFMILPLWGLVNVTPNTSYGWFQFLLILRGGEIGLVAQPLMRAALVNVPPRQLSQASSLMTVVRFVAGSLITAILGSMVQGQQQAHYAHLAEQVTPGTPTAQLLLGLQARLQAHGMDAVNASHVAIMEVVQLIQRQAYSLALQDGYRFTFLMLIPAILAVLFVRAPRVKRTQETMGESAAEGGLEELLHAV
jgi:DHA2 family multidrug resistance protein